MPRLQTPFDPSRISGPEPSDMTPEEIADADQRVEEAERQLSEMGIGAPSDEVRVNLRWERGSLDVVRQAAQRAGVTYQTYLKQVAYRQALTDLKDAALVAASNLATAA